MYLQCCQLKRSDEGRKTNRIILHDINILLGFTALDGPGVFGMGDLFFFFSYLG
jgi:hypothetical protein